MIQSYTAEDDLIDAVRADGRARARIYRCHELAVVLGRSSRVEVELHTDACRADRVPIYRRRGGGCSVVLDPGDLILAAVAPLPGIGRVREAMRACTAWALDLLAGCGVAGVALRGTSDLAIGERKIGGSSLHRTNGFVTYGVTLLVEPDLERVERYLAHPPREPQYRRGRTHRDFMGSLVALGAWTQGPERLRDRIARELEPPVLS